ncbi:DNA polymerase [Ectothiorhodosinus mongolicus]|uniref:Type-4 uracil-DNA glycosylase n=2 Tax=Ectothiorhodosinus mongolicus TaxID=233100 RepID=A0A1R3W445_9GAMM|nr:uracil-DNA glycosylase [Ectothiorhodosinus mongolicus]SIT72520.1 DNA polymerase [Ectothiorhodosinus mongolicus]
MTPQQRQRALRAMGIDVWVPRAAQPEAAAAAVPEPAVTPIPVSQPAPPVGSALVPVAKALPAVESPQDDWQSLMREVAACQRCPELAGSRTQTVFGAGDPHATWMFIGEAPGADEDQQGEAFLGRSGQLLDRMLAALGISREQNVYLATMVKCRPPKNRDPLPEEAARCRAYLDRQIAAIKPKVLVALGRVAAQNLLDTEATLASLRGQVLSYQGIPLIVTYHPAYLLQRPADKRHAWDDLCLARGVHARLTAGAGGHA